MSKQEELVKFISMQSQELFFQVFELTAMYYNFDSRLKFINYQIEQLRMARIEQPQNIAHINEQIKAYTRLVKIYEAVNKLRIDDNLILN
jgi:hypothetical protein